jgi:molecular chaperone GrpE
LAQVDYKEPSNDLTKEHVSREGKSEDQDSKEEETLNQDRALEKKLEAEIKKSAELSKRALYLQADLMNSQRQAEKRIVDAREETSVKYIEELISLKEDLERALVVAIESKNASTLNEGLEMLLSKLDSFLESDDVRRISVPQDSQLDTRFHEAVAFSDAPNKKDGAIVAVIRNGYTFRGKVIKAALVEVARSSKEPGQQKEISAESSSEKNEGSS